MVGGYRSYVGEVAFDSRKSFVDRSGLTYRGMVYAGHPCFVLSALCFYATAGCRRSSPWSTSFDKLRSWDVRLAINYFHCF